MELIRALEVRSLLHVGEFIAFSALHRKESRGAHSRTDYPKRDDKHFLHHSLVHKDDKGNLLRDTLTVVITRHQPEERKY